MFSRFANTTVKTIVGRFNVHTTERHKMIKAILANSDNCGDIICGDPKLVKEIIKSEPDTHHNTTKQV